MHAQTTYVYILITVVRVSYNKSSYTLSEAERIVEICVNAESPGTAAEFSISSTAIEDISSKYTCYVL